MAVTTARHIRIADDLWADASRVAEAEGLTPSGLVVSLLRSYVESNVPGRAVEAPRVAVPEPEPSRELPAALRQSLPVRHACCKHCRHGGNQDGHADPCTQGCH